MITAEFKSTRCQRAEEVPTEKPDGSLDVAIRRCSPREVNCNIVGFFLKNKEHFLSIAAEIESTASASDELRNAAATIRRAMDTPDILCGSCSNLADSIIAVDGKDMTVFAANNDKDWILLAKVLGRELLNPAREKKRGTGAVG
jgi:hypothetical protein